MGTVPQDEHGARPGLLRMANVWLYCWNYQENCLRIVFKFSRSQVHDKIIHDRGRKSIVLQSREISVYGIFTNVTRCAVLYSPHVF